MQVLTIDIGTGTQDIFLFQSGLSLENDFKLVLPSPTMRVRQAIGKATRRRQPILLMGVTMGGGPSQWATEAHLAAGLPVYATPEAALTFNDDLGRVEGEMGVTIVSADEAARLHGVERIVFQDLDVKAIWETFSRFGIELEPAAVAVAVFDHGAAPPDISDRQFRFDYLRAQLEKRNSLSSFAFPASDIPASMTRLQAVAQSAGNLGCPLIVMDTAPAAVLGAKLDPIVAAEPHQMIANIGNFHTLAFRLGPAGIEGLFEHHTGLINLERLEALLLALADGSVTHQQVFDDQGHGALVLEPNALDLSRLPYGVAVTGPRRRMMAGSKLRPYFAVPFGDMMMAGCLGLLVACQELVPEVQAAVSAGLAGAGNDRAPWDMGP
jgi:uncharacterized protein (DUF1786 family)